MKDKNYYESLDKRTKEYKEWWAKKENPGESMSLQKKESEGLGDTVEKITKKTGIKKAIEWLSNGKDCGCEDRKNKLNEIFRYKPNCMVKSEYEWWSDYRDRHDDKRFSKEDVFYIINLHTRLFKVRPKVCINCNGSVRVMNEAVDNINKIYETYK